MISKERSILGKKEINEVFNLLIKDLKKQGYWWVKEDDVSNLQPADAMLVIATNISKNFLGWDLHEAPDWLYTISGNGYSKLEWRIRDCGKVNEYWEFVLFPQDPNEIEVYPDKSSSLIFRAGKSKKDVSSWLLNWGFVKTYFPELYM